MKKEQINIENRKYWNILKGIGILFIVMGHASSIFSRFVYLFHLPLFFFIGGYLYSEEKYRERPYDFLISKLKSNWKKYVLYSLVILYLHNIFLNFGLITGVPYYSKSTFIINTINSFLFLGQEQLAGALWFVPVYVISSVIFASIVYWSNRISKNNKINIDILIIILTLLVGSLGVYAVLRGFGLLFNTQIALLVVPFFCMGYFLRKKIKDISKILRLPFFILSIIILSYMVYKSLFTVDLAIGIVSNFKMFYFAAIVGIYFSLYLAKILSKIKYVSNVFDDFGKYSFEIMAFHFVVFKLIDLIINIPRLINHTATPEIYGIFPVAYKVWPLYIIFGVFVPMLFFKYIKRIKLEDIKRILRSKKFQIVVIILLIICISLPILKLGVMQNDELISRLQSFKGFGGFFSHYVVEQVEKGRALASFIIPISMYTGFISRNTYIFKGIQFLSLVVTLLMFIKLLNKVFKNKSLNIIYILLFLSFLPITFEPTSPSVFTALYNIPLILLIYSFILFIDYLETNNNKKLVISMIIFILVELNYEAFITYIPIYLLLYIYKKGIKNIFKDKKCIILPIMCGVLYLVLYYISGKIFSSNYPGNQINFFNIINSLKVIKVLGFHSLPGSYLISDKYHIIYNLYYSFSRIDLIRLLVFSSLFLIVFLFGISERNTNRKNQISISITLKTVLMGILMIILPILPVSLSKLYQDVGTGYGFLGIPVSFFCYFGSILVLSIIVVYIIQKSKIVGIVISIVLLIVSFNVQKMNNVISREASNNFHRVEMIEQFIDSGIFSNYEGKIYSNDLFITKNALVITDDHWINYTKYLGLKVEIIKVDEDDKKINLYYQSNDDMFKLLINNNTYYISKNDICNKSKIINDEFISKTKINNEWNVCREEIDGSIKKIKIK